MDVNPGRIKPAVIGAEVLKLDRIHLVGFDSEMNSHQAEPATKFQTTSIETSKKVSVRDFISLKNISLVVEGALLTGLASHIRFPLPFTPVPVTLQTSAVLFAGAFLGAWRGSISQLLMLCLGALGAPFFATGPAAIFGPTGGYLVGFVLMAWAAGFAYSDEDSFLDTYFKIFLVSLVVFVPGVIWLKFFTTVSWIHAIQMGFIPFVAGDLVKTGITTIALRLARR